MYGTFGKGGKIMRKIFLAFIFVLAISVAAMAVPLYINYQGVLRNAAGNLQNGTFNMTFKIYNAATAGSSIFDSGTTSVSVANGLYSVSLGPISNPAAVFDGADKWLEVTVGTTDVLSPRLKINSVAYSINAGSVNGPVSAEAASGYALFVNGKMGASTCVGEATITGGNTNVTVSNSAVTSQSLIIPIIYDTDIPANSLKIDSITPGVSFVVSTINEASIGLNAITFRYIIIN